MANTPQRVNCKSVKTEKERNIHTETDRQTDRQAEPHIQVQSIDGQAGRQTIVQLNQEFCQHAVPEHKDVLGKNNILK